MIHLVTIVEKEVIMRDHVEEAGAEEVDSEVVAATNMRNEESQWRSHTFSIPDQRRKSRRFLKRLPKRSSRKLHDLRHPKKIPLED